MSLRHIPEGKKYCRISPGISNCKGQAGHTMAQVRQPAYLPLLKKTFLSGWYKREFIYNELLHKATYDVKSSTENVAAL